MQIEGKNTEKSHITFTKFLPVVTSRITTAQNHCLEAWARGWGRVPTWRLHPLLQNPLVPGPRAWPTLPRPPGRPLLLTVLPHQHTQPEDRPRSDLCKKSKLQQVGGAPTHGHTGPSQHRMDLGCEGKGAGPSRATTVQPAIPRRPNPPVLSWLQGRHQGPSGQEGSAFQSTACEPYTILHMATIVWGQVASL